MVLRAAVIGCGRIGSEFDDDPKRKVVSSHCGAYSGNTETKLVAVSDISAEKLEKARKRWNAPAAYSDYREMLAKEKPDIISVCTHSSTHLEIIEEAVKHKPKLIFCEKPLADGLQSARKIVEACKAAGVLLAVDHQRRYDAFHQNVRKMVLEGKIGKIQQATFYYTAGIATSGSHALDYLRFYLGDAEWVQAQYSATPSNNPNDPNIDAFIRFKNGASAALQACDGKRYNLFELTLIGTDGRIAITRSGYKGGDYYKVVDSDLFGGYKELAKAEFPFDTDAPREFLKQAAAHIVECVQKNRQPHCTGEDGAAAVELICAITESAKQGGKKVQLPLAQSDVILK